MITKMTEHTKSGLRMRIWLTSNAAKNILSTFLIW